jgi:hypothetical protein
MDEHHVDIYHDAGVRFRAGPVLELAEGHGVRGTVELLLPYTVSGPGYVRGVFESLRTALRMLKADRIDEGIHWLGEAASCVPARSRTLHRPTGPHPGALPAPPRDPAAPANQDAPTRSPAAAGPEQARVTPARHTRPVVFEAGQAPAGELAPAVEVHVYPARVAGQLARSAAAARYLQPEPGAELRSMHLIGTTAAGPDTRWREMLDSGAAAGTLSAVAVSDPHQIWPENRLDDPRWQQVAQQVATAVDPQAPWAAFRTRPDAIVVFNAASQGCSRSPRGTLLRRRPRPCARRGGPRDSHPSPA